MESSAVTRTPLVLVESKVPFVGDIAGACVRRLSPDQFTQQAVRDADAMIIRTRTRCDARLLEGSRCRVIATATIGTDHIDIDYCARRGIAVYNAPGCNAPAVAQYVMCSIASLINRPISQHTLVIVGVGHVGRIVERWARALDMRVLRVDPPRRAAEGGDDWCDLAEAMSRADIVTLHTPLTRDGEHATYHLLDAEALSCARRSPIIINAARGAVVDTRALIDARRRGAVSHIVTDCWEGEPDIDRELLSLSDIATPHIAGYSRSGKIRATLQALSAVTAELGLPRAIAVDESGEALFAQDIAGTVSVGSLMSSYDPMHDEASLKAAIDFSPSLFETLRNTYTLRPEPKAAVID